MDTFVFAVGTKKAMAKMQKDMQDLVTLHDDDVVILCTLAPTLHTSVPRALSCAAGYCDPGRFGPMTHFPCFLYLYSAE